MKVSPIALVVLAGSTPSMGFTVQLRSRESTALFSGPKLGAGGMADTRDPDSFQHEDPRKSISVAPSFEEYLKQRGGGAPAPAAPSPMDTSP